MRVRRLLRARRRTTRTRTAAVRQPDWLQTAEQEAEAATKRTKPSAKLTARSAQPEHSLHEALVVVPRARRPFLARAPRKGAGRSSA